MLTANHGRLERTSSDLDQGAVLTRAWDGFDAIHSSSLSSSSTIPLNLILVTLPTSREPLRLVCVYV
jgi:hypothetical protein